MNRNFVAALYGAGLLAMVERVLRRCLVEAALRPHLAELTEDIKAVMDRLERYAEAVDPPPFRLDTRHFDS